MLRRINLNDLGQAEMLKKEMSMIRGGSTDGPDLTTILMGFLCDKSCGCEYEGTKSGPDDDKWGGSTTSANRKANGGIDDRWEVLAVGLGVII